MGLDTMNKVKMQRKYMQHVQQRGLKNFLS